MSRNRTVSSSGVTAGGGLRTFVCHLRLPFQLVLSPVFLIGWAFSGAAANLELLAAFVLLHAGLYAGATAFNSFYDRDTGPIGGLRRPPPTSRWEREGGLALQTAAAGGLAWLDPAVGLAAAGLAAAGLAYSHPRLRWKARPYWSLVVVAVGQGVVPLWMGRRLGLAGAGTVTGTGLDAWAWMLAIAGAGAVLAGVYPLTQVYQIEEDAARGDRTFAVHLGPAAVFAWGRRLTPAGCTMLAVALAESAGHPVWLAAVLLGGVVPVAVHRWESRFSAQTPVQAHDWYLSLASGAAACLGLGAVLEILL